MKDDIESVMEQAIYDLRNERLGYPENSFLIGKAKAILRILGTEELSIPGVLWNSLYQCLELHYSWDDKLYIYLYIDSDKIHLEAVGPAWATNENYPYKYFPLVKKFYEIRNKYFISQV